jgi:hypothetical protein
MQIQQIQKTVWRVLKGTTESNVFYIQKCRYGSFKIYNCGNVLGFEQSKKQALKLIETLA